MMKNNIFCEYERILEKYSIVESDNFDNLLGLIKEGIREFIESHSKTAIYCYGVHTEMLMADFMIDLKGIHYIVDNYKMCNDKSGFKIITEQEVEKIGIDSIIISSFKFKERIKDGLSEHYKNIHVFDIYDYLKERGIYLESEYYRCNHPYHHYYVINKLHREIESGVADIVYLYKKLISEFLSIKDFRLASEYAYRLFRISKIKNDKELADDLSKLYKLELEMIHSLNKNHVVMLCVDGLKRENLSISFMSKTFQALRGKAKIFSNAYSYSTSTFESLIPVYSENYDMRKKEYHSVMIEGDNCRFIKKAKEQKREIHFYTQVDKIINDDSIHYLLSACSVTQMIWNFLKDANIEQNGLYYLHILYESHYSFSNPYTKGEIIAEGTAMLFDYLDKHGGKLRTDYVQQNEDAIMYLDDTLAPFIQCLPCQFVLYSDHGNIVLKKDTKLKQIHNNYYTCHEDWIRIPMAVYSFCDSPVICHDLVSLSSINELIISLLETRMPNIKKYSYIKIGRSELYNPDFRFLYKMISEEKRLLAFEGFVFSKGYKLIIYSNGISELFDWNDNVVSDNTCKMNLLRQVEKDITVTNNIFDGNVK